MEWFVFSGRRPGYKFGILSRHVLDPAVAGTRVLLGFRWRIGTSCLAVLVSARRCAELGGLAR